MKGLRPGGCLVVLRDKMFIHSAKWLWGGSLVMLGLNLLSRGLVKSLRMTNRANLGFSSAAELRNNDQFGKSENILYTLMGYHNPAWPIAATARPRNGSGIREVKGGRSPKQVAPSDIGCRNTGFSLDPPSRGHAGTG